VGKLPIEVIRARSILPRVKVRADVVETVQTAVGAENNRTFFALANLFIILLYIVGFFCKKFIDK